MARKRIIPTCQIHQKYSTVKCANPAINMDPDGYCILHSRNKEKDEAAFNEAIRTRMQESREYWDLEIEELREYYDLRAVFFPDFFNPERILGYLNFPKRVDFSNTTFTKGAYFSKANFAEGADFYDASFEGNARFHGATFNERAVFLWTRFTGEVEFSEAIFIGKSYFTKASFTQEADFSQASFQEADFSGATFTGAVFSRATFSKRASFSEVTFKGEADFSGVTFTEEADFIKATFDEEANFFRVTFKEWADFSYVIISGLVRFQSVNPEGNSFSGAFRHKTFINQGALLFQDLSLAHIQFEGTDLRRPQFNHVSWHPYNGRQAIYDEVLLRQEEKENPRYWHWFWTWVSCHLLPLRFFALESGPQLPQYLEEEFLPPDPPRADKYGEVERLNRNLKLNCEGAGDLKNAGDFHYGEMEMHRRANKWRWFPFYWYNLYWALSGYGERPSRALGWLVGFLFGISALVWWFGLPATTNGFLDTLSYIFEKVTFQRPKAPDGLNWFGGLATNFSVLLIPGQAALFLLALRNRLGRRR